MKRGGAPPHHLHPPPHHHPIAHTEAGPIKPQELTAESKDAGEGQQKVTSSDVGSLQTSQRPVSDDSTSPLEGIGLAKEHSNSKRSILVIALVILVILVALNLLSKTVGI